jgi:hypothetical protein
MWEFTPASLLIRSRRMDGFDKHDSGRRKLD